MCGRWLLWGGLAFGLVSVFAGWGAWALPVVESVRGYAAYLLGKAQGGFTIEDRLAQYGPSVAQRVRGRFEQAGLPYPPAELAYLAFKDSRVLEVYGRLSANAPWRFVMRYPVRAASGTAGPKLAEGDEQVPEGIYRPAYLNPNSRFHLSIGLDYPNAFDQMMAQADGRTRLGNAIMIHGGAVSVGCLAMGDDAAEDLFVLAALLPATRLQVLIAPTDWRKHPAAAVHASNPLEQPAWVPRLYRSLQDALGHFPLP